MSAPSARKRFIAGAICPSCGVMDRIVVSESEARTWRECVRCGHVDALDRQGRPGGAVPRGRLDVARRAEETEARPVRILERPADGDPRPDEG